MNMKKSILILLLIVLLPASAYPNQEMPAVFQEGCPDAVMGKDLVFQDDGNGLYLRYISSACSIPNATEAERLWGIVQEKRVQVHANKLSLEDNKTTFKNQYVNQINNLDTVIYNSRQIQQETNWTNAKVISAIRSLAWGQEVMARFQQLILRTIRYIGEEIGWFV